MNLQASNSLFFPCLSAFKTTLNSTTLSNFIYKSLLLDGNQLKIANRFYLLNKNVHLIAIGKAAPIMVETTEKVKIFLLLLESGDLFKGQFLELFYFITQ
jgi:hypothetical protein